MQFDYLVMPYIVCLFILLTWFLFEHVQFPYYEFVDRASMYKVGSVFYAIYFIVSFPMFLR